MTNYKKRGIHIIALAVSFGVMVNVSATFTRKDMTPIRGARRKSMYPEPSINDHGAEWNLDDDGNCDCTQCRSKKREDVDDYEYHYRRDEG